MRVQKYDSIKLLFCFLLLITIAQKNYCQSITNQLYAFDFGLTDRPALERTKLLANLGYKGLCFSVNNTKSIDKLNEYLATDELKSGKLNIPVLYYTYDFTNSQENGTNPNWKKVMNALPKGIDFWLIVNKASATPQKARDMLRIVSTEAARLGKNVVIYPHDNDIHFIESIEDALPYLKELKISNLYVTFHLCHEFRDGNKDRLREVFQAAQPYIKYVSISGALAEPKPDPANNGYWGDGILPLDQSELDLYKYVQVLKEFKYNGPVFLHTYGITRKPEDHLSRSKDVWTALTNPVKIPGSIEAELFSNISGSVKRENRPEGKENLGSIVDKNFTEYIVSVAEKGQYNFDVYASSQSNGGFVEIYVDGILKNEIAITPNGALHNYQKFTKTVTLNTGEQRIKLLYKGKAAVFLFNIDKINITKNNVLSTDSMFVEIDKLSPFPNPSKDGLFYLNRSLKFEVLDMLGRIVSTGESNKVNLTNEPKGIYILRIGKTNFKLIK
jgi:hypothetical protein